MRFENKVVVITGGARGIGYGAALKFKEEGGTVVIGDLSIEKNSSLVLREDGIYEGYLDVSDETVVREFIGKAAEAFSRIDVLVNNAGIARPIRAFEEIPRQSWDLVLDINTFGTVNCCNAVIPMMKEQKGGKIINSSSLAGEVGGIRVEASYSVSKSANICLTMALAKYLGPFNINVNAVSPGFIKTDMGDQLDAPDLNTVPLRRLGEAADVANAIAFLASEEASYLTGVVLDVNGGVHMR